MVRQGQEGEKLLCAFGMRKSKKVFPLNSSFWCTGESKQQSNKGKTATDLIHNEPAFRLSGKTNTAATKHDKKKLQSFAEVS